MKSPVVLVCCSGGGHWIQMRRLLPALIDFPTVALTVDIKGASASAFNFLSIFSLRDFNRFTPYQAIRATQEVYFTLRAVRPTNAISTGAAPGLITILLAKFLFNSRCLWIDSIANTQKLSLSGRIAKAFGVTVYTQWNEVASLSGCEFNGRVI